ncbi:MAG: methionine--tRNA ligase [Patescibacteria group bacterium]
MSKQPYYITTAIAYANGAPHIGFALEYIYTDAMARYQRLLGNDVVFVTGMDEHGQKIARKAAEAKLEPKAFVDGIAKQYQDLASRLSISYTDFIRTTEDRHKETVTAFWNRVIENGKKDPRGPFLYTKKYTGLYCVGCESFKTEKDLVDGKCLDHPNLTPEQIEEENYFFKLTAFEKDLLAIYEKNPNFATPETKFNEAIQLVKGGLEDISVSRSSKHVPWGIPVPGDDSQNIYVWFDALVNYLSALGFPKDEKKVATYWPTVHHVIGKEINRFHTVLWPAMLMAAGVDVPKQVAVHGWILAKGGGKMSKTLGNVLEPDMLLTTFGVEATRYLLLREIPFNGDGEYDQDRFVARFEADLSNNLGNLVLRVASMIEKYRTGVVGVSPTAPWDVDALWATYQTFMNDWRFDQALETAWTLIRDANKYIDDEKPWALAKENKDADLDRVLFALAEAIRHIGWMIRPFMPQTSDAILTLLGQNVNEISFEKIKTWGGLPAGTKLGTATALFPRLEEGKK